MNEKSTCRSVGTTEQGEEKDHQQKGIGAPQKVPRARPTKEVGSVLWSVNHNRTKTTEYRIWRNMRYRCNNPNSRQYQDYGGRGISVCPRWDSFVSFLEDMGSRPKGKSIDRINNDANYEPSNCRWATMFEQNGNTRTNVMIDGKCASQIAREIGVHPNSIYKRLKSEVPIYAKPRSTILGENHPMASLKNEDVLAIRKAYRAVVGARGIIAQLAREYKVSETAIRGVVQGKTYASV